MQVFIPIVSLGRVRHALHMTSLREPGDKTCVQAPARQDHIFNTLGLLEQSEDRERVCDSNHNPVSQPSVAPDKHCPRRD